MKVPAMSISPMYGKYSVSFDKQYYDYWSYTSTLLGDSLAYNQLEAQPTTNTSQILVMKQLVLENIQ
jgi:hypothetical protein